MASLLAAGSDEQTQAAEAAFDAVKGLLVDVEGTGRSN